MYNIFQLSSIACAYKQARCERKTTLVIYIYKKCDLLAHQCERKKPHSNAYFLINNNLIYLSK